MSHFIPPTYWPAPKVLPWRARSHTTRVPSGSLLVDGGMIRFDFQSKQDWTRCSSVYTYSSCEWVDRWLKLKGQVGRPQCTLFLCQRNRFNTCYKQYVPKPFQCLLPYIDSCFLWQHPDCWNIINAWMNEYIYIFKLSRWFYQNYLFINN